MTVEEMIKHLQKMPPKHIVIVDLHSEFAEAGVPSMVTGYNNGGYISRPYSDATATKAHGYVHIPVAGVV